MKKNSILIIFSSFLAIYAILGFVAVPKIVKPQIEKALNENLTQKATLEKVEFNPFLLKFTAHKLKIFDEKETTVSVDKLLIDFSIFTSIDEQHISFKDLQLVNPYVNIIEYEDGTLNLQKLVIESKEEVKEEENEEKSSIKFQIYRTILDNARIKFKKLIPNKEPFKLDVDKLNYTFYEMGTFKNTLASHSLRILVNKNSELIINGGLRLDPFKMHGNVELKNFRPKQLLTYKKEMLNFDISENTYLNLRFGYRVDASKKLKIEVNDTYLDINNLDIKQEEKSILSLKNFSLENLNLNYPENKVSIDSIFLNQLNSNTIIDENGVLNYANLIKENKKESSIEEPKKQKNSSEETINPWRVTLNNLDIKKTNINFQDLKNALSVDTKDINIVFNSFNLDGNDFSLDSMVLNKPTINFKDDKNNLNVTNKELEIQINKLSSKNAVMTLNSIDVKNSGIDFKDLKNSLTINSENVDLKLKSFSQEKENISLENIALNTPKISFSDNKSKIAINTNGLNLNANKLNKKETLITLNDASIKVPVISFNDKKNNMTVQTASLDVLLNSFSQEGENLNLNKVNVTVPKLIFKDNKNKLHVFTKTTTTTVSNIKKVKDNTSIANISLKNPSIFVRDYKNSLKIVTNALLLEAESLNLNGSNVKLKKAKVKTPTVKFNDLKNKLDVTSKNINVIATDTSLVKEKLKVAILSLTKPTISMLDNKNNKTIVAKRVSLKLNNISNYKDTLSIAKLNLHEPDIRIKDKKVKTDIIAKNIYVNVRKISNKKNKLKIVSSSINKPYVSITLGKQPPKAKEDKAKKIEEKKPVKVAKKVKKKGDFQFDIGPVKIKNMKMTFEDKNLPIPFKTDITKLNGNFTRFNSSSSKPTKLELEGKVDKYGYTKITGTVDINDIKLLTDTNLLFKNIAVKNFTPYSGKFVGREINSGKLNLDLKYNIKKSDLKAENSVIIDKIKFGNKVESPDAANLPLELAIALLEDSDGVIDINLPVTGNVDDPQFSIAPIVWKAFFNLIMKAITSPFSLLGAMLGVDEEQMKSLEFEFGKSEILASEKETLDNIAKILAKKPKLAIKIKPVYDPTKDKVALQDIKFEQFLIKEMDKIPEGDDYKEALEDIYEDIDGVKDLDDIEKSYTKKDKNGKKVFDNDAYVEYLRKFLSSRQTVTEEELKQMAKTRVENIKKYLLVEKKVPKEAVIIEKISKQEKTDTKWAVFELGVDAK